MIFSCSDFIGGCEEFTRLHGRQALMAGWVADGPARAEQAGFGDAGDGDGIGLVAAENEEIRVVLADREADVAARTAFKDLYGAGDGLALLAEPQRAARPIGVGTQRAEQWFIG